VNLSDIKSMIDSALEPVKRRAMNMIGRCILTAIEDGDFRQKAEVGVLNGETLDGIERFQDYGFTSVPLPGAEGIMIFNGGNRDNGVIIRMENRDFRLTGLEGGEVAMYTDEGDKIVIKRGGDLEVNMAGNVIFDIGGKYKFKGISGVDEIMQILSDFSAVMKAAQVVPAIPFNAATLTAIQTITDRLDAIRVP